MTETDNIQAWTDSTVNEDGDKASEARKAPLRTRQKEKPAKPAKARRGAKEPVEIGQRGSGRANLYVQAKARPVGVIAAWTCVGLLAAGSALGAVSFLAPKPEPVVQQTGMSPKQQRAGAEATGFVSAWLSATSTNSEALNRYLGNKPASIASRNPVEARNLSAASIEKSANGSLVVTVSGEVKTGQSAASAAGKETPTATASAAPSTGSGWVQRWWTVALSEQSGGFAVLGLPSPVAGPGQGSAPSLAYQYAAAPELTKAITDFLAAYAAGVGDVSRYVSPGSGIGAITPAPYTEVRVRSVDTVDEVPGGAPKDKAEARALVVVDLVVGDVQQQSQYALTLTARGGQWEVSTVEPAPVLIQKK